ncbi:MAG: tetratricopeptide repeat protein [Burkholderiaceae bacterium]|nr:tetratricopeptide repeat protein [Burkholderiaceae bacterium]
MVHTNSFRTAALIALLAIFTSTAQAQKSTRIGRSTPPPASLPSKEALDAELFYEIVLGEMSARTGDPGAGYALMLEAARRSSEGQLYQRATDIALQSRSGEFALIAAQAWKEALPQSREANRYILQILVALNRMNETLGPLRQELAQSPAVSKVALLSTLPQMYSRAADKALAAQVVELALKEELTDTLTGSMAWISLGRLRLAANDRMGALEAAQKAQELDKSNEDAALLAMNLMEVNTQGAEQVIARALEGQPSAQLSLGYVSVLIGLQRFDDASRQLETITQKNPGLPEGWFLTATLQAQNNRLQAAEKSLARFTEIASVSSNNELRQKYLAQSYFLHSQIEEKRNDFVLADAWMQRIEGADNLLSVQARRAALLARQGKITEARTLLRKLPDTSASDKRMKLLAEVDLLRGQHLFKEAYEVQGALVALDPDDSELAYDQAMLAEKAGDLNAMEQLLRKIIARQPQYHHAYNALGYSFAERGVNLDEAKQLILKALEIVPNDPFIVDSLGWVEFRLGNKLKAKMHLEAAYKARADTEIAAHLGEILWSLGDADGAVRVWTEGQRSGPNNETLKETLKRLGVTL